MNKKIKKYIDKQEKYKKEIFVKVRNLLIKTIDNCSEDFNWGVPIYDEGKFYIASMKTRIHVGFAINGLSEQEIEEFEGSGKTMRHIKIHNLHEFDKEKLTRLFILVHKKATIPPDYK